VGSGFELVSINTGLPDDRHERSYAQFLVVGNRHRASGARLDSLHDDVTASAAHFDKTMKDQNGADGLTG
jgi:hypothetical protein